MKKEGKRHIIKSDLFNGRQVFNEMNDLNLKTYPISIHFIAFKVDFFAMLFLSLDMKVDRFYLFFIHFEPHTHIFVGFCQSAC